MAAQNLVLVTRTDNGKQFKVSTTKIIEFKAQSGSTLLTYVDQRGKVDHRLVDETVAAINALTGSRTQAVTLNNDASTVVYINSDRIIFIDNTSWGSRITYDVSGARGKYNQPPTFIDVTEAASAINTAAGNTGAIPLAGGGERYVNGDNIDLVVKNPDGTTSFRMLYDSRLEEFKPLVASAGTAYLSLGSGWA
jgi:hypothetical protein